MYGTKRNWTRLIGLLWLSSVFFISQAVVAQDDPICAVVKIEIKQELTLERQAFEAQMKIHNALDTMALENVSIVVNFEDETGNTVLASSDPNHASAKFFIRVDTMQNIANITGSGTVAAATTADVRWLIIPAPGAAQDKPEGAVFFVGATLTYNAGGEQETITVAPDRIVVKPLPRLTLDYFLERHVFADDAFTPEIEPAEPFTLGVRIKNNGLAPAKEIKIESAQPEIVENEQGLLIGFEILGGFIDDKPAAPNLLLNFGTIDANRAKSGRWQMVTSLSGEFTEFTARFTHADELGGALTSIMEAANTHFLIKDVLVDQPGRDTVLDFFADDGDALRVYESDNVDTVVVNQSASADFTLLSTSGADRIYSLIVPVSSGLLYIKLADPMEGAYRVTQVLRADGKSIPLSNTWFSRERNTSNGFNHFINLFDSNNTSGQYFITVQPKVELPIAPALQFISDKTVEEGEQVAFLVQASDGNKTIPVITANPLPTGATFTLSDTANQVATYVFDWLPQEGQDGRYEITYTASDGVLTSRRTAYIQVNKAGDSDGDGMDDQWELDNFGTLDRDGTGDFDGDGISDLDEFTAGTDPSAHVPVNIPGRVEAEFAHTWFDTTPGNQGDAPCSVDDYDAQFTTDTEGFCHIFNTAADEWTEYRVNVADAGWFDLVLRLSTAATGVEIFVEVDGVDVSGTLSLPQGNGLDFVDHTLPLELTAGVHTVRVNYQAGSVKLNYLDFLASEGPQNQPPVVQAGADANVLIDTAFNLNGVVSDDGVAEPLTVTWTAVPEALFADPASASTTATFAAPGEYVLTLTASDTEFTVTDTVVITVIAEQVNAAPVVNAGADTQITVGLPLTLQGSVTDDGLISPTVITWSGTGGEFVDAADPTTSVTFSTAGEFVLTLTADDGQYSVSDTVTVIVVDGQVNAAPVVDAGANAQATVGLAISLSGAVTDDGLALPLTSTWSAEGDVVFADANNPNTSVTFHAPGEYVLTLTANDTEFTVSDSITVTVVENPVNTPPVVNAGSDIQIDIGQPLTLTGSVTDDAMTSPLTVTWQPVTGATFADITSPTTTVTFSAAGVYTLTLSANDSEYLVNDAVTVQVVDPSIAREVLYVSDTLNNTGDAVGIARLQELGFSVRVVEDDAATAASADGASLVVISGTVNGSSINSKFAQVPVPVVLWESPIYDDMGMTLNNNHGAISGETHVTLLGNHSLTGGLRGDVQVVKFPQYMQWGIPGGDAVIAAHIQGDPSKAVVFGYEAGGLLANGEVVPAKRVSLFIDRSAVGSWTGEGKRLFDAAVQWALLPSDINRAPQVSAGPDTHAAVGVPIKLEGWATDDGRPSDLSVSWISQSAVSFADASDPFTTATFAVPGEYVLTLSATDGETSVEDTVTVTVNDPEVAPAVLYVTGFSDLPEGNGDRVAITHLEQQGFVVYPALGTEVITRDVNGMSLVIVSGTIIGSQVNTKFTDVKVPVLTWEPELYSDLGMTHDIAGSDGRASNQNLVTLIGDHTLTGGLAGTAKVVTYSQYMSWGVPSEDAIVAGHLVGDPSKATVFGYEAGSLLANGSLAPAKRIGIYLNQEGPVSWTAEGKRIFDAAVQWALQPSDENQTPLVDAGPTTRAAVGMPIRLEGWVTDDGKPSALSVHWNAQQYVTYSDVSDPATSVTFSAPGEYVLTLSASDGALSATDTVTVSVNDPLVSPAVLFVGGYANPEEGTGDRVAITHLEQQGFVVYSAAGTAVTTREANGMSLVIVSGTIIGSQVNTKFADVTVPVLTWEPEIYTDLGMTLDAAGSDGRTSNQNHIVMTGDHTLTAGLSGDTKVVTYNQYISWGIPGGDAIVAAHVYGDITKATIFGYEKGGLLPVGTLAPAKRVGLYLNQGAPVSWTAEGKRLFDAAVQWALQPSDENQAPLVDAGPTTRAAVGVPIRLEGWVTDDGKPLDLSIAWQEQSGVTFADVTSPKTEVTFGAPGEYILVLNVSDGDLGRTDSVTVSVTDPDLSPAILVVGGSVPFTAGDDAVALRLTELGYVVHRADDDAVFPRDANGMSLVVISGTVHPTTARSVFKDVIAPVLTWEPDFYDDLGMTLSSAGSFGRTANNQNKVTVIGSHPLTAGLNGDAQVLTQAQYITWGVPNANAAVGAHVVGDAAKATIFAYSTGSIMADGSPAKGRRIGFFLNQGAGASMTASGRDLFDVAVSWAVHGAP